MSTPAEDLPGQQSGGFFALKNLPVLGLVCISVVMLFWRLGAASLAPWDEASYAQIAKEILQTGDWTTLRWAHEPWFDKPPLFVWVTAGFYELFGVNEFSARLASALSGLGLLFLVYRIAAQIEDKWTGILACTVLLTTREFLKQTRFGTTDALLTFLIFLALFGYLQLRTGNNKWWYLIWVSGALAFMAKGPASFSAALTVLLALVLEGNLLSTLRNRHFWMGLLCALIIVAPWHVWMLWEHGDAFTGKFLGREIITRATGVIDEHSGGRLYYVEALQLRFYPWFYVALFAVVRCVRENLTIKRHRSLVLFLLILIVFCAFTIAQTKSHWYIFPVFPALAILTASTIRQALRDFYSFELAGLAVAGFFTALVASPRLLALAVSALAVVIVVAAWRGYSKQRLASLCVLAFLITVGLNKLSDVYSTEESPGAKLGRLLAASKPLDRERLFVLDLHAHWIPTPTIVYYSNRPAKVLRSWKELDELVDTMASVQVITHKEDVPLLAAKYEWNIVAEVGDYTYGIARPLASSPDQRPSS